MGLGVKIGIIFGVLVVSIFVGWYFAPRPMVFSESFEQDFGGWAKGAHVPPDPSNPGHPVTWDVSRVTSVASSGRYSSALYIDGRQDDGTVWIERKIVVEGNSQVEVTVSFEFYSEAESFNVIASVCAFAGLSAPEVEEDFAVLGPANEVAGWKVYTHSATLLIEAPGEVWVALGITVRWETEMTYHIDNVKVSVA